MNKSLGSCVCNCDAVQYMVFHIFIHLLKYNTHEQYDSVNLISVVVLQFLFNRHLSSKLTATCTSGVRFFIGMTAYSLKSSNNLNVYVYLWET